MPRDVYPRVHISRIEGKAMMLDVTSMAFCTASCLSHVEDGFKFDYRQGMPLRRSGDTGPRLLGNPRTPTRGIALCSAPSFWRSMPAWIANPNLHN